ncbi:diguanylate cyclase (GGDEF) domain-containing protein [Alkalithermobacter thermoalcaliphilus JW-YL-7 = DSM 7308]|uniref:Diguanylate cyclase (GGDEF) domain-containing protein n=1 Tax=Alkalithermobacter thermoalcaliphilus JW-YL-7 = DSM 7308 TaxID=1121328 RepID=A0A150FTQ3_CLOPD|nr:diguanylate cyclase and metal dependent phosphohydrolase [[Clostridium] paradoxum JW-YL-7 = DSM 7308]SHK70823.1 diguanylate cyclase (GGDEF) domain-containing protein [[Clostridium] paradoxum JW-YL-7 = DSM 7308]
MEKLFNENLIVKKLITFTINASLLSGIYLASIHFLDKSSIYENIIASIIAIIVFSVVVEALKDNIESFIDKILYKDNYSKIQILNDFSKKVNNTLDIEQLSDQILETILSTMKIDSVSLLLKENNNYITFQTKGKVSNISDLRLNEESDILKYLKNSDVVTQYQIYKLAYLENDCYKGIGIIVPIRLRENIIGMFILPQRHKGYDKSDIDFLLAIANSSAIAIENAKLYTQIKLESITDSLTKLYNRRYFKDVFENLIENKILDNFSVALIDVDHFKLFNDLYGHYEGDKALKKLGDVLKNFTRPQDIVARYGGEEFAIILPNLSEKDALELLENLRKCIQNEFNSLNDMSKFLTVSIGIANFPRSGITKEDILKKADKALYSAKKRGKNQCVVYEEYENEFRTEDIEGKIENAYFSAVHALAATIDAKDRYTYGHSENVSKYAVKLAKAAGFSKEQIEIVKHAGLLHDVGKIGIPEHILTKPSRLSEEEMEIMKKHVDMSVTIIKHIPNLVKVLPSIICHHERYDGLGYPRKIKGESIPIEGRCLAIADAFDAMTTDRPYRKAMSIEDALREIQKNKSTQFDPYLADIFISLFDKETVI